MLRKHVWSVLALALLLTPTASFGALTPDQQKCQKRVGNAGGTYLKKVTGLLEKCRNKIASGSLPPNTDCTVETATAAKIATANESLTKKIQSACPDSVVASLTFGGQCVGSVTATALANCLILTHTDQAV